MGKDKTNVHEKLKRPYQNFNKINGKHPWRDVSEKGYIDYPVRYLEGGEVVYFNFPLAREIGLIPHKHPAKMNERLEKAILQTFAIRIINEYDQARNIKYSKDKVKANSYMATRYLQLQHQNKLGDTSGDGRSVWNGYIKNRHKTFDFSSNGTGVTQLSPGAQMTNKPIKTGDDSLGYSSGLADIDEMLAGAIMSEIFYREGHPTERCLTVIKLPNKKGIAVRTAPNLIRPAHFFRYLKKGEWRELKDSYKYFLKRQEDNGFYKLPPSGKDRYEKSLKYIAQTYARLAAMMEEEYIFNWLAWDGDNMLASGAILDYGSIRQFAAKHNKYRYEDADRFSTCLTEQKREARYLIQTFAQLVDFLNTKDKKNIQDFADHPALKVFDDQFEEARIRRMLWRIGFTHHQTDLLLTKHKDKVLDFRKVLNYFEHCKTSEGEIKVADGVDHPPIFLVRHVLRDLPSYVMHHWHRNEWPIMPPEHLCNIMAASYVDEDDMEMTEYRKVQALTFQYLYKDLVCAVSKRPGHTIRSIVKRSAVINFAHRRTGDGLIWIVNEALNAHQKMDQDEFQSAITRFIESQILIPEKWEPIHPEETKGNSMKARLLRKMKETMEVYAEAI